jgi:23S rRNA (cytidine2498-2'-O)-methyltransferase
MHRFVFTCEPEWEQPLVDELLRVFPKLDRQPTVPDSGVVELAAEDLAETRCVALCAQCLPYAETISIGSISDGVRAIADKILAALDGHVGPWRLHLFAGTDDGHRRLIQRCELIRENVIAFLKAKRRRLWRAINLVDGPWQDGEALAQVRLSTATNGHLSICDAAARFRFRRMLAPFCGGIGEIPADNQAPSRAFAKLIEAEIRLGRRIEANQTCVDLGSSPGSWAYVALNGGARVVAVDRSPLRDDLMTHPSLEFVRGDAFKFQPSEQVDWLLCDVVAPPEPIIQLFQSWIAQRWCRRFCVTIKFRGTKDYAVLEPLKNWLAAEGVEFVMRRLTNNKNEVTVAGELAAGV